MSNLTTKMTENTHIEDNVVEEVADTEVVSDSIELPPKEEVIEEVKQSDLPNNVISLDMGEATRTNIWVNGDCTKVLKLNLTDMNIIPRFSDTYPKLLALQDEIDAMLEEGKPEEIEDIDGLSQFATQFKSIDKKMREYVDYIFDYGVSDICCDGGSMYDLVGGGTWRFEYIIDKIGKLYNQKFGEEMRANEKRMNMHTNKYTGNNERYSGQAKYTKSRKSRK